MDIWTKSSKFKCHSISVVRNKRNGISYLKFAIHPKGLNLCEWLKEGNAAEIKWRKYKSGKQRNSFTEIVESKLQKM
jgi:hypothetical protein